MSQLESLVSDHTTDPDSDEYTKAMEWAYESVLKTIKLLVSHPRVNINA